MPPLDPNAPSNEQNPDPAAAVPPSPAGGEGGAPQVPAAGAAEPDGAGSDSPPAPPHPSREPQPDWRDKRIQQLTGQLKDARRAQAEAAREPASPAAAPPAGPDAARATEEEIDRRASLKAAEQDFLRRCDDVQKTGIEEFGKADWDSRVTGLRQLVNQDNQSEVVAWNGLLIAAMETGEGHRLLHALGENLNEAQRIMSLPSVRMAVELTKMAGKLAAADPPTGLGLEPSGAPRPIRPVGARGVSHQAILPDDPDRAHNLPIDVWMQRRSAQVKERGIR